LKVKEEKLRIVQEQRNLRKKEKRRVRKDRKRREREDLERKKDAARWDAMKEQEEKIKMKQIGDARRPEVFHVIERESKRREQGRQNFEELMVGNVK